MDPEEQEGLIDAGGDGEQDAAENAAMAKKNARQARFRAQAETGEGVAYARRTQERYKRALRNGNIPLSGGKKPAQPHLDRADFITFMAVAAFFDTLSFILSLLDWALPGVGTVLAVIFCSMPASFIFYLMYKKRGVDMKSAKVAVRFFGGMLLGAVPIINSLPEMMLAVTLMFSSLEAEEKLKKTLRSE